MNIDWFTFAAQIINFLVLVALLRWLLYGRIVQAMKKREHKIKDRVEDADRKKAEAQQKVSEYEQKSREIQQEREALRKQMRHDAQEERKAMLEKAREEVDRKQREWEEGYRREREEVVAYARRRAGELGTEVARRTLEQLAAAELEGQIIDRFTARVADLGDEQRAGIEEHLEDGESAVTVRSAFAVPPDRRERLREAIAEAFGYDGDVRLEEVADLICGVELDVGGYSVGWNVNDFLEEVELEFDRRLVSGAESQERGGERKGG